MELTEHTQTIHHAVWETARRHPHIPIQDLEWAGYGAYVKALETWDKGKASFNTHLTWRLRNAMDRELRRGGKIKAASVPLDEGLHVQSNDNPERATAFRHGLECLGREAAEIIHLIFNQGDELADFTAASVTITMANIRRYLHAVGWKSAAINKGFNEIKEMLRSL